MNSLFYPAAFLLLVLSACTIAPEPDGPAATFEPPIVDRHWQVEDYPADNTGKVCIITAGRNAIEVVMKKVAVSGVIQEVVHSTRNVDPGASFTVRIDADNYRTNSEYFPFDTSKQMIAALLTSRKAYFEWYEQGGASMRGGRGNIFHNMTGLAGFKAKYEQCKQSLNGF